MSKTMMVEIASLRAENRGLQATVEEHDKDKISIGRNVQKMVREFDAERKELQATITEQQNRLEFFCEGTDGSTPAIVTICRLKDELDKKQAKVEELIRVLDNIRQKTDFLPLTSESTYALKQEGE